MMVKIVYSVEENNKKLQELLSRTDTNFIQLLPDQDEEPSLPSMSDPSQVSQIFNDDKLANTLNLTLYEHIPDLPTGIRSDVEEYCKSLELIYQEELNKLHENISERFRIYLQELKTQLEITPSTTQNPDVIEIDLEKLFE